MQNKNLCSLYAYNAQTKIFKQRLRAGEAERREAMIAENARRAKEGGESLAEAAARKARHMEELAALKKRVDELGCVCCRQF